MTRKKTPVHHCGEEIERSRGYRRGRAFTILPAPSRAHNGKKKEAEKLQSNDGEAVVRRVAKETDVGDVVGGGVIPEFHFFQTTSIDAFSPSLLNFNLTFDSVDWILESYS
ncbi:unnamed protein product [Lactuca saligna]|uniref:Uncharacterized protein n=1 Tax=Lactuca saligna TaxID=75948 RepID=A0AA35VTD9_LACSI|nr:unnamed protein product [Lactuca saligna]